MISQYLYSFITAQSAITTLVSTRIYPVILPEMPVYPALTYRASDHNFDEDYEGMGGPVESSYYLDSWGETYSDAVGLANTVRTSLNNTRGNFGGIHIHKCVVEEGPIPVYEDAVDAYRITQIFLITHKEV